MCKVCHPEKKILPKKKAREHAVKIKDLNGTVLNYRNDINHARNIIYDLVGNEYSVLDFGKINGSGKYSVKVRHVDCGTEYWVSFQGFLHGLRCKCEGHGVQASTKELKRYICDLSCGKYVCRVPDANDGSPTEPAVKTVGDIDVYNYMWDPSEFSCTGVLKGHDSTALLASINVPVLYICGEYDSGTFEAATAYNAKTNNGEICVLPGCAHNASRERPVEFNAVISAFADRVSE